MATIVGDSGNNTLIGTSGDDSMSGLGGDDFLGSGAGNDTLDGGPGNDFLSGTVGDDSLAGGDGDDSLYDDSGNDTLLGGSGNDTLDGGPSADSLSGGDGNDFFKYVSNNGPYAGATTLAGGAGSDTFDLALDPRIAQSPDTITDFQTGAGGDIAVIEHLLNLMAGYNFNANPFTTGYLRLLQNGPDTLLQADATGPSDGANFLTLLTFENTVATSFTRENFGYPNGNPQGVTGIILTGDDSANSLNGTPDNDTLSGNGGDDNLTGYYGNDSLSGGSGNDFLFGWPGDDTLSGDDGNDTLSADYGNDLLIGGTGDDSLIGGNGFDTASYSDDTAGVNANLTTGTAIGLASGNDSLNGIENLIGGIGNDTLIGDLNGNNLSGNSGNDSISSGVGSDTLSGGAGNDSLDGGDGVNTAVFTGARADYSIILNGSTYTIQDNRIGSPDGTDQVTNVEIFQFSDGTVVGQPDNGANDSLSGSGTLDGGFGNDTISISYSLGDDSVTGGPGDDLLIDSKSLNKSIGNDTIDGGAGNDTVSLDLPADQGINQTAIFVAGATQTIGTTKIMNVEAIDISGGLGNDTFSGDTGNDIIYGGGGNDLLSGGAGNDTLDGGSGNDTINGGNGVDLLSFIPYDADVYVNLLSGTASFFGNDVLTSIENVFGSFDGNDTLIGDNGDNSLNGGSGGGHYSLSGGDGNDTLTGIGSGDTLLGGNGNDIISNTYSDSSLSGDAGADTLNGGGGNDTIDGGAGTDTAIYSGAQSNYAVALNGSVFTIRDKRGGPSDGTDTVTNIENFQFSDGTLSSAQLLTLVNQAPTAVADFATALEAGGVNNGTSGSFAFGDVLSNDTDPDSGDTKTMQGVAAGVSAGPLFSGLGSPKSGLFGTLTLSANGSYIYLVDNANANVEALNVGGHLTDVFTYTMEDGVGATSTATLTITINGADDAPNPAADGDIAPNSVTEGAANGSLVGVTAHASDVDGPAATYTLTNDAGGRFAIDANTGVVSVANGLLLDFETATSHVISVLASDGTLTSTRNFTIAVSDVNDVAPTITSGNSASEAEHVSAANVVYVATATDPDTVGTRSFALTGADASQFAIDAASGAVRFISSPDYAAPTDANHDNFYQITVHANDGVHDTTKDVTIGVIQVAATITGTSGPDLIDATHTVAGQPLPTSIDDTIIGLAGDDTLDGGPGNDMLRGGIGDDTYIVDSLSDSVIENANEGSDTIRTALSSYTLPSNVEGLVYTGTGNFSGTGFGGAGSDTITGGNGNDTLNGGWSSDDLLIGGGGADYLYGGFGFGGNNTLVGGPGGDRLFGGFGNDSLDGGGDINDWADYSGDNAGFSANLITGLATGAHIGNDTLVGTPNIAGGFGNDTLIGGDIGVVLQGGAGNDSLSGNKFLLGGAGNDTLVDTALNAGSLDGGSGDDLLDGSASTGETADYGNDTSGVNVDLVAGRATGVFSGNDTLIAIDNVMGGSGNDTLLGDGRSNILLGAAGNDSISGGDGNDDLVGGIGDDTAAGGNGNDTFDGNSGNDSLSGDAGNDVFYSGAGNDTIDGGPGYDVKYYFGSFSQYTIVRLAANSYRVVGLPDGAEIVSNVEEFRFSDQTFVPPIAVEAMGATTLAAAGNHFSLLDNNGTGPSLIYLGGFVVAGQFGAWAPIGAEKTVSGYEIAWKFSGADQYTLWSTDANGNYIANLIGAVPGSSATLMSAETLFQQDLNGDGQIGLPTTPIETAGATILANVGNHFGLLDNNGAGPSLKYLGSDVAAGQLGGWTPIGAEKTASGYEIAWKFSGADQYTLWSADANGNYVANIVGKVSGSDLMLVSSETLCHQDLNGDGQIGLPTTLIESKSATTLAAVGNHFALLDNNGVGPSLKYSGGDVAAGQFGGWAPIGAEKTASGYEIAWKVSGADQYTLWSTDANGNYIANLIGAVPGSNLTLMASENLFQQDLNGDGQIGLPTTPIETTGATSLAGVGNHFALLDNNGAGPSLKYSGGDVAAGQFGGWAPIGAEKTASGYEIAWKALGADQYTLWSTDANGNYIANLVGAVPGSNAVLMSSESLFQQDLNGDGQIGLGTTTLASVGNHFSLLDNHGVGPSLKYSGNDVVAGQFGAWAPIGVEKTVSGYEIAWKVSGSDQYTLWSTDTNGNYIANIVGAVPGSNSTLMSAESLFQQDLNGDGQIGIGAAMTGMSAGMSSIEFADQAAVVNDYVHPEWLL